MMYINSEPNKSSVEILLEEVKAVDFLQKIVEYYNKEVLLNFKLRIIME